jgi:hypothetical protein
MVLVETLEFEETDAVTAPAPSPTPLATGTVVTTEKVLDDVAELAAVEAMDEELADAEAEVEDPEELDEDPDVPGEPESALMLCHDPDMSV